MSEAKTLGTSSENSSEQESEISNTTTPSSKKKVMKSKGKYRWTPGQSGNPSGRPLGSKNKITRQKLELEESLREHVGTYMHEILQKAIELAMEGDRQMIKLLVDTSLSKAQAVDDTSEGKDKVQVTIRKLSVTTEAKAEAEITTPKDEETVQVEPTTLN